MSNTNTVGPQLMRATLARLEAERQNALATIELYLHAAAGVGEHPDIVGELVTAAKQLAAAEECLQSLDKHFLRLPPNEEGAEDDE